MKIKLPKALLIAVLAGSTAMAAASSSGEHTKGAFVVTADNTINITEGTVEISNDDYNKLIVNGPQTGSTNEHPLPIVKDGQGTLTISQKEPFVVTTPLVVREGTVEISGTAVTSKLANPNNFVPYLTVGGKNASLVLDNNSSLSHKYEGNTSSVASFTIGSADGSGSLTLKGKSTLHTDHYIQGGDPDGQSSSYGGAGTGYVKYTENLIDGTYTRYSNGTYNEDYHAKVTIEEGSTLSAGTSLQFSDIYVKVTGEESLLTDGQRGLKTSSNHCSYLGHENSYGSPIETKIDIEKGASFVSNWNLITGAKKRDNEDNPESVVNITVGSDAEEGKTSTFKVKGHFAMGGNLDAGKEASINSNTTVTVKDGAEAHLNLVSVGGKGKAKLVVENGGAVCQVAAEERYAYQPVENEFSKQDTPHMLINETGTVENSGIIELDITVAGGTYMGDGDTDQFGGKVFTILDGAVVKGLTMTSGTVNISGEVYLTQVTFGASEAQSVATYSLRTLSDENNALTINISDGTTINADDLVIDESTTINMVLAEDDTTGVLTITGTDADKVNALKEQLQTINTVDSTGANIETGAVDITTNVVPEPTTATLSLLALAGLAARRRRR